jgi:hypothetical protein
MTVNSILTSSDSASTARNPVTLPENADNHEIIHSALEWHVGKRPTPVGWKPLTGDTIAILKVPKDGNKKKNANSNVMGAKAI